MRDRLRQTGSGLSLENRRPPIFLLPGLASTRLVAWRPKSCKQHPFLSDIRVQDYVWLNINLLVHSSIDVTCMQECLQLGDNQTDTNDLETGCKLRPDEGLDAIASLSPTHLGSQLLVGGTNTVYAWLIQWLADHLGYDVTNIVGLPYDWRLSPDKMQARDGFLTLTRRRLEAAVQSNGAPGIFVAHSMGNTIFRYFLEWLKAELQQEAYQRLLLQQQQHHHQQQQQSHQQRKRHYPTNTNNNTHNHTNNKNASLPGWVAGKVDVDHVRATETKETLSSFSPDEVHAELWRLAQEQGESDWRLWMETHIWTYVGLSAPLLGAANPLKAVISGENMGLPFTDEQARIMELTFGSTHTINPVSSKRGFCDEWDATEWKNTKHATTTTTTTSTSEDWGAEPDPAASSRRAASKLACLDDILTEIEVSALADSNVDKKATAKDPWQHFPALKRLLRDRADWDTEAPLIKVVQEMCELKEKSPCANSSDLYFGPRDAGTGHVFAEFNRLWKEKGEPLHNKREQLRESFWDPPVSNILNQTWERPLIKHVIMGYGVDTPTEIGYVYRKRQVVPPPQQQTESTAAFDGVPDLQTVVWETAGGQREEQRVDVTTGGIASFLMKKPKRVQIGQGKLLHSGDGSVPYLSLAWAQTWLLDAIRARRFAGQENENGTNPLEMIEISHRPKGATEWKQGPAPEEHVREEARQDTDTGTNHPHGTKYKPEMLRYHVRDTHPTTGVETTTTVLEAIGVEHKETTRNYDILAAVFTDVLNLMHDDLNIV